MAELILIVVGIYTGVGIVFAAWFVSKGVGKMDASASNAPWSFRAIILPGVVGLWPIVLGKCLSARDTHTPQH